MNKIIDSPVQTMNFCDCIFDFVFQPANLVSKQTHFKFKSCTQHFFLRNHITHQNIKRIGERREGDGNVNTNTNYDIYAIKF